MAAAPTRADEAEGDEEHPPVHRRADAGVAHAARRGARRRRPRRPWSPNSLTSMRAGHVEALGHLRVHRGVVLHLLAGELLQPAPDAAGREDEQRQHDEREQRQPPLEGEHRGERGDEHDDVADDAAERAGDRGLGADDVVVQPADVSAPVGVRVKNATGIRCTLANSAPPQVVDQPLADPRAAPALDDGERGVADGGEHGGRRRATVIIVRSPSGIAVSRIARTTNGGTRASRAAARMATRNRAIVPRYGRAKPQTRRSVDAGDPRACHRVGVPRGQVRAAPCAWIEATGEGERRRFVAVPCAAMSRRGVIGSLAARGSR